ncbi:Proline and glycine rich transmembrane protein [Balamuthia mandrillaris]
MYGGGGGYPGQPAAGRGVSGGGGGYPPQPYQQGGYPPSQYPQQGGYPPPPSMMGGYPQQQQGGYPPPTYQGGGYPPPASGQTAAYQKTTITTTTTSGPPSSWAAPRPPPTAFKNNWYSSYYQQLSPAELYEIQAWFQSVDTDRSGSITANELATITFNGVPLGYPVAFKLLQVFDQDRSGTIDFYEYASLHKFMSSLQTAFFSADRDRSGRLDAREIHSALATAGFQLSLPAVQALMAKYDKSGYGITFQDFMMLCATVAQGRSLFQWRDTQRTGRITLSLDQLLELVGQMS